MDLIDMLEMNKTLDETITGRLIKKIFSENFNKVFIENGITGKSLTFKQFLENSWNYKLSLEKKGLSESDFIIAAKIDEI